LDWSNLDVQTSREGAEAWERVKKGWDDWVTIGKALWGGREWAMHQAKTDQPAGSTYNIAFSDWLEHYKLQDMDKGDRARLFKVIANLPEIEAWRNSLEPSEQRKLNHPTAVLRRFKAAHAPPKPPREKSRKDASAAALDEAASRIHTATDRLDGVTFPGGRAYDLSPGMITESAANFRKAYGAEASERFAAALQPGGGSGEVGLLAGIKALYPHTDRGLGWPEGRKADAVRKKLFTALGAAWALLESGAEPRPAADWGPPHRERTRRRGTPLSAVQIKEIADRAERDRH
jgi:hypothetical protein